MRVSIYNLLILFYNYLQASKNRDIGHQEINKTEKQFIDAVNRKVTIPIEVLESLLYYSNMSDELSKFWHPDKVKFSTMVSNITKGNKKDFDFVYNLLENKKKDS